MAKRKKRKSAPRKGSSFFKPLLILGALGLLAWLWQGSKTPAPKIAASKKPAAAAKAPAATEKKEVEEPPPAESQPPPEAVESPKLTGLFPNQAWLDNYLQVPAALEGGAKSDILVALGIAPAGKNPDQIRDPDQLRPELVAVKKENGKFIRRDTFDFSTVAPTEAGIRREDLRGLPRITPSDLVDMSGDGKPEILVKLDTHGAWTEAVGLLQWENGRFQWAKTSDAAAGSEKIALWLSGSTSTETQEVNLLDTDQDGRKEIVVRRGRLDPKQPAKGFVWTTTVWKWKEGSLVKQ